MSELSTFSKNETRRIYGELTVVAVAGRNKNRELSWECLCSCGRKVVVNGTRLRSGRTRSCGHIRQTHGHARSAEYRIWTGIKRRCTVEKHKSYGYYGGRGISVCQRWLDSFENFLADMGRRPHPSLTVERKDNEGNYEPGNCVWATRTTQDRNKRSNHWITHAGLTLCLTDWAKLRGIKKTTLSSRLRAGWPIEDALR